MNRWLLPLSAAGAAVLFSACRSPGPKFDPNQATDASQFMVSAEVSNKLNPAWLVPPTNFFTLGPGDQLQIELLGDPSTRTTTLIGADGKMYFYLLPGLDVWGLTLAQTRDAILRGLTNFIRESPTVSLTVRSVESQRVWLLGRLNTPGVYALTNPLTLLEALATAGGPAKAGAGASLGGGSVTVSLAGSAEEAADLSRSFVLRRGQLLPVDFHRLLKEGDMSQNIYLEPDDLVYLPSVIARNVYVLGAVAQPKAVPFSGHLSLVAAVSSAGGTIKDAYLSHVAIVRGSLTSPRIAVVDYKDVVHGKAPDILLEPHDIVYVPFTPYRVLSRYVDLVLQTFVRTVGANEGARAISPDIVPVSPNVPIGGVGP